MIWIYMFTKVLCWSIATLLIKDYLLETYQVISKKREVKNIFDGLIGDGISGRIYDKYNLSGVYFKLDGSKLRINVDSVDSNIYEYTIGKNAQKEIQQAIIKFTLKKGS
mgnify:CR=1 FL=1